MKTKAKKFKQIATKDKVQLVAEWLDEKQANDITAVDVQGICPIAEVVMVAGAKGIRHSQALADFVLEKLSEENIEYLGMEGYKSGDWILLDLNDIIVHIFQADNRKFYNVEGLWSEGTEMELNLTPQE
ncbi:ribosome silencing factor [Maridesulfovibrio sp.]|uniref:ribosome silencing factor n=1 Tax=Maridesulfovibrio sp. TaxID=2795000 RepID=UPI002A189357|nr:ribosome silencing factor [Maridesulfovibrio sp.]